MYQSLADTSLEIGTIKNADLKRILTDPEIDLLHLLQAANQVRHHFFGNKVRIHILHNVQSGNCGEDCNYCAQSSHSDSPAETFPMKSDEEIIVEAENAYKSGAYRHCIVFSGRDLRQKRVERVCQVVEKIKAQFPMEICVSAGFLDAGDAARLNSAGVNRYNHNINTSAEYYTSICTTHNFEERIKTINIAKNAGMDVCSGVIIGMGESNDDVINMIEQLKKVGAKSVPVNFFIPVQGHQINSFKILTPNYCLRVLSAFRLALPESEIRMAAGREYHLRSMQSHSLYAANSIFAKGYLTTDGDDVQAVKAMIHDAGMVVETIDD